MDATFTASGDDVELIRLLRQGDEAAFMSLVERLQPMMLRVARMYVSSRAVAEEVVQEAWLGVLQGFDRFEGRSSLRTWILRIVTNIAKTRGQREGRSAPFASLAGDDLDAAGGLGRRPGGAAHVVGDPRCRAPDDRRAAAHAGTGDPPARRPGMDLGRGP